MRKKLTFLLIAILASLGAMASPPHQDEGNVAKWNNTEYATLQDAFDAAEATANPENIVIDLLADASLDITARANILSIGTADTKTITINGNDHQLTFLRKNTDWNDVSTANDDVTKLILNKISISQAGVKPKRDTWNAHGLAFSCAVELNNVQSSVGLIFKKAASLNTVSITEASAFYSVWIQPNGQTVDIDGLNVTATNGGRGIKVDDQYVDDPQKVTLNIANSTFNTAKKAAVLLKSAGGAQINDRGGNNIDNVAADSNNFVWIDEEDKPDNYSKYNLTSSNGATMVLDLHSSKLFK